MHSSAIKLNFWKTSQIYVGWKHFHKMESRWAMSIFHIIYMYFVIINALSYLHNLKNIQTLLIIWRMLIVMYMCYVQSYYISETSNDKYMYYRLQFIVNRKKASSSFKFYMNSTMVFQWCNGIMYFKICYVQTIYYV